MKISYKILKDSNSKAKYYLYILKKLKAGFYQKNGFLVLSKSVLNNQSEVIFPIIPELINSKEINNIIQKRKAHDFPFNTSIKEEHLIPKINFNEDINYKEIEKFISKNKSKAKNIIDFLLPEFKKNIEINIVPVTFGTAGTFNFEDTKNTLKLIFTMRMDIGNRLINKGIISSIVLFKLKDKKNKELEPNYWEKRQFLLDFLSNNTSASTVKNQKGTLETINSLKQLAKLRQESKKYLNELGFEKPEDIKMKENSLEVNGKEIYLTNAERRVMNVLINNKGKICSFDEVGNAIWENEEKFSYYAISRTLSDIRKKIKNSGFMADPIYTARGRGVILTA